MCKACTAKLAPYRDRRSNKYTAEHYQKHKDYFRQKSRERRERLHIAGKCVACGVLNDRLPFTLCSVCAPKMRAASDGWRIRRKYKRGEAGLCLGCGGPKPCLRCAMRHTKSKHPGRNIERRLRLAEGRCASCYAERNADPKLCETCLAQRKEKTRNTVAEIAKKRLGMGLCRHCGCRVIDPRSKSRCRNCLDYAMEKERVKDAKRLPRLCSICGAQIAQRTGSGCCRKCGIEAPPATRCCKTCGVEVGKGYRFCAECSCQRRTQRNKLDHLARYIPRRRMRVTMWPGM